MKLLSFINRHKNQRGQVIVFATAFMFLMIGFVGVVVDVGDLYTSRRKMQTAADAAAIAGANALQGSNADGYESAAGDVATLNGFTNNTNGVTVAITEPTSTPPNGTAGTYVQVSISQPVPTYFLRVLGYSTMNVQTQAVAGAVNGPACIYALDPNDDSNTLEANGSTILSASCGIIDNSTSRSGLNLNGSGSFVTTGTGVAGSAYGRNGSIRVTPAVVTEIPPASDPLASLPAPTVASCTQASVTNSGSYPAPNGSVPTLSISPAVYQFGYNLNGSYGTVAFSAGTYGNGISLNGSVGKATFSSGQFQSRGSGNSITANGSTKLNFADGTYTFCGQVSINGSNNVTLSPGLYVGGIYINGSSNVTFNPGTYILAGGGMTINGSATTQGTDVTFYDTTGPGGYGPITINGSSAQTLSAPTSGTYKGILFFQDRSIAAGSTGSIINGSSRSVFDGALYFPTTTLTYNGSSSGSGYTFLIAYKILFNGSTNMTIGNNYSSLDGGSPIVSSSLYE